MANFILKPTSSNDSIKFQGSDGSAQFTIAGTTGSLGSGIGYPAGHILQTVSASFAGVQSIALSSGLTDVTSLSCSMTITSGNKVFILAPFKSIILNSRVEKLNNERMI